MTSFKNRKEIILLSLLAPVILSVVTGWIIFSNNKLHNEYDSHLKIAIDMERTVEIGAPHFLFHILAIAGHRVAAALCPNLCGGTDLVGVDDCWRWSALAVMAIVFWWVGWLQFIYFKRGISSDRLAMLLSFSMIIIQPIFIFAPYDHLYYLGYLTPANVFNIPTQILLKLFTIAVFMVNPVMLNPKMSASSAIFLFTLVIACGLAKPNFLLIMIPSLSVLVVLLRWRKIILNNNVLFVLFLSSLIILLWQFYFKFIDKSAKIYSSEIILTYPFEVFNHYSGFLLTKQILSILFPLICTVSYLNLARRDFDFIYAWILYAFGLLFTVFLAESGSQKYAGNFIWSGQIGVFVLFLAGTRFFFANQVVFKNENLYIYRFNFLVFSAHVACGILYYGRSFFRSSY